jgi:AraC-like DNA-binding protein
MTVPHPSPLHRPVPIPIAPPRTGAMRPALPPGTSLPPAATQARAARRAPAPRDLPAPVATVLTPNERIRVDAAGEGLYRTLHRESLDDVLRDLRQRRVAAVLVSVARCAGSGAGAPVEASRVAALVREFPRVPAVALLSEHAPDVPRAVLTLGRSGVRALVDARSPAGWRELRGVLAAERAEGIDRLALDRLNADLAGAPDDCRRFFEQLFTCAPRVCTVRALSRGLGVLPSTLMSRFFRSGLPAPKRYLAYARLTRAARLFENPGLSVASVANHLDYSSPQSFGRHVRTLFGLTAVQFRRRYDGEGMLERFREELILPHLPALRVFTPLTERPSWLGER